MKRQFCSLKQENDKKKAWRKENNKNCWMFAFWIEFYNSTSWLISLLCPKQGNSRDGACSPSVNAIWTRGLSSSAQIPYFLQRPLNCSGYRNHDYTFDRLSVVSTVTVIIRDRKKVSNSFVHDFASYEIFMPESICKEKRKFSLIGKLSDETSRPWNELL